MVYVYFSCNIVKYQFQFVKTDSKELEEALNIEKGRYAGLEQAYKMALEKLSPDPKGEESLPYRLDRNVGYPYINKCFARAACAAFFV